MMNLFKRIAYYFDALLDLMYPTVCISCEKKIDEHTELFCLECQHQVRMTELHESMDNEFTAHFPTFDKLISGSAMYYYIKTGRIQKALELLKYKNRPEIGTRLGQYYGNFLHASTIYADVEYIIPVPLHTKRKAQRGYNQSEVFANGLAETMKAQVRSDIIFRRKETQSQTEKNRADRIANMKAIFYCKSNLDLNHRKVLLVDDILTTGATLQSCAETLVLRYPHIKLYMATIAMGN
ncbi:MAG TPA: phosphoribosyltransferase family protein [Saprospiraceae bacterium]|jgi:ComF family protein|nr:ComF family protein [Saprospiraceae bacterium]HUN16712.1 phosphoribosyltransferase family protein [Saprospiraceae bacterium]